jgi:hypothetical protein
VEVWGDSVMKYRACLMNNRVYWRKGKTLKAADGKVGRKEEVEEEK